jgi:hypothetical protein
LIGAASSRSYSKSPNCAAQRPSTSQPRGEFGLDTTSEASQEDEPMTSPQPQPPRPRKQGNAIREITSLADAHLREHAAKLLAQAEASRTVRNLRLEISRKLVDLEAKSLCSSPARNGGPQ